MRSTTYLLAAVWAFLAGSRLVHAHTWIEQLMLIAPNGTMVGDAGFARGNILRSNPAFNDPSMVNLIPPNGRTINQIFATDAMCRASQQQQVQTNGSPRLKAPAGAAVALRYQENGHVSLPGGQPGKPNNRGTVYVYGTTNPKPNENFLDVHRVWNADGTGGDKRGILLSTQNYDDGQCYQVNSGPISQQRQRSFSHQANALMGGDIWCQQDVALPISIPEGKPYTLYWVWDWPTLPGTPGFPDGKQEIYTSCMDIDIVASTSSFGVFKNYAQGAFVRGQSLNNAAIQGQMADILNPTAVNGQTIAFKNAPAPATPAASSSPSSSSLANSASNISAAKSTAAPVFMSAHTASNNPLASATRSIQTLTVAPIRQSQAAPQNPPTSSSSRNQQPQAVSKTSGAPVVQPVSTGIVKPIGSPQTTAKPNGVVSPTPSKGQKVVTVTEIDSITETVYHTVFRPRPTKRAIIDLDLENGPTSSPEVAACSKGEVAYRLRARNPFFPYHVGKFQPHPSAAVDC